MKLLVVFVVVVAICHAHSVGQRDELEDEEQLVLQNELARRQGKVTGSYDHDSKSGSVGYEHTFNDGKTKVGGSVDIAQGSQPGYGVSASHTFRSGVKLSGYGRFHPSGNNFGAQVSIPLRWGKRATTSVDLPEDLEDEEQLFLRAAPLARRQGSLTGSYDHNSRTGRLGYTHTFRNGASLSGYGSFHPGGHGFGASFSIPLGKRASTNVDLLDEVEDEEEMLQGRAELARRRGSLTGSYDHNSRTGRLGYTHTFRNGASLSGYGSFHPGGHGFGASFSIPLGKRTVAYIDLPDEVEDEEEILLRRKLARRQGKVTGSYDHDSKSGSLGYQHTLNNGRTRLGGSVHFARGQQPGYGVSGSHTFRNGVKLSGYGNFHPSGNSYGAQVSIPLRWGKRATTSVDLPEDLEDEEQLFLRAAQLARRRGKLTGSYDHNSRTGRLGYTHTFRNGASLSGYGSFHPGGHGFGASFSIPLGKRASTNVDLPDEVEDEEEMLQGRAELARRRGSLTGSYDHNSRTGRLGYTHTFRNGASLSGYGSFHPGGHGFGASFSIPLGKRTSTNVDLLDEVEDEEEMLQGRAELARRRGSLTGSYDHNSRTGRLGYTHTFRNGASLSGYGSFHPGGHGFGASFSIPLGKRARA